MGFMQHQMEGIHLDTTTLRHDFRAHVQDFQQETRGELAAIHVLAEENDHCWDDAFHHMGWRRNWSHDRSKLGGGAPAEVSILCLYLVVFIFLSRIFNFVSI